MGLYYLAQHFVEQIRVNDEQRRGGAAGTNLHQRGYAAERSMAAASARTVGASNSMLTGRRTFSARLIRVNSFTVNREYPPKSKKLSVTPNSGVLSTSRKMFRSFSSSSFSGDSLRLVEGAQADDAEAASAFRSILPLPVRGNVSINTKRAGTM